MIDFNRENFNQEENEPGSGEDLEALQGQLQENLTMQQQCEVEVERCRQQKDIATLRKVFETVAALRAHEVGIREQISIIEQFEL